MPMPRYLQVVDCLAALIDDGYYTRGGGGGKLPSLRDLGTHLRTMGIGFTAKPTTLKMALAILEDRGAIEPRQGAGWYVTGRPARRGRGTRRGGDMSGPSNCADPAQPDTPCAAL